MVCSFISVNLMIFSGGVSSFVAFTAFPSLREKGYVPIQG